MSIIKRYEKNPILTRDDIPYPVATVHNAAVTRYRGQYIMLFRSHLTNGRSILGLARSDNGYDFTADPAPFMTPANRGVFKEYEEYGIEDPRITFIDGEYLVTYSAYSRHGTRIGLARTRNFKKIERFALITEIDYRNAVIFPEKFAGLYVRMDRPHSGIIPWSTWVSYSPDLRYWGDAKIVMKPLQYHWDEMKIGPGAPPFRAGKYWVNIYHGVYSTMDGSVYRLGAALHDGKDPSRIVAVCDHWILQPEEVYEITGYVHNVVFTCAAVPEEDGTVKIYWGGADTVMCVGTARIDDLVQFCLEHPRPPLG